MTDDERLAAAITAARTYEASDPGQRWGWWNQDDWDYPWAEGIRIAEPGGPHCRLCRHFNSKISDGLNPEFDSGKCLVNWRRESPRVEDKRWANAHDVCDRFEPEGSE